jgi:hypothetical protein
MVGIDFCIANTFKEAAKSDKYVKFEENIHIFLKIEENYYARLKKKEFINLIYLLA